MRTMMSMEQAQKTRIRKKTQVSPARSKLGANDSEVQVHLPGSDIELLGSKVDLIGSKVDLIESKVDLIGSKVNLIGSRSDLIGSKVDLIGSKAAIRNEIFKNASNVKGHRDNMTITQMPVAKIERLIMIVQYYTNCTHRPPTPKRVDAGDDSQCSFYFCGR
jgi:hypothetical protein